jgi:hypothetical protein
MLYAWSVLSLHISYIVFIVFLPTKKPAIIRRLALV